MDFKYQEGSHSCLACIGVFLGKKGQSVFPAKTSVQAGLGRDPSWDLEKLEKVYYFEAGLVLPVSESLIFLGKMISREDNEVK